jgi:stage IV sporulation protein FB
MLRFHGKIPVVIHPFFWLTAALIGWLSSGNVSGMIVWIGIILLSVLIHEMGHAFMALIFKKHPVIELVPMGGVTSYDPSNLSFYKQFLITFCGPLFGFFLFLVSYFIVHAGIVSSRGSVYLFTLLYRVNFFWTIVNLLPVLPLDGGQLLRIVLESIFGIRGFRIAIIIGIAISFIISLSFFALRMYFLGVIFFLFTFQSFDILKKSRYIASSDRNANLAKLIRYGEVALQEGRKEDAKKIFERVRSKAKKGIIYGLATNYLAMMDYDAGEKHKAYELLLAVKEQLPEESSSFLQKLAFEEENFDLVIELSSISFQVESTVEVALRNARAFAVLNQPEPAGGWLQRAVQSGPVDIENILSEKFFNKVKDNPEFLRFIINK